MSPEVEMPNHRATELMKQLFEYMLKNPQNFSGLTVEEIRTKGLKRSICDYIASMTDRSVILEYERIFNNRLGFMHY